ncbi:MAG: penicillin-binding protein, partial [Chloroflexi bacterium]|nr:penicillin-binding protein [Chloroflexota bacterium]
MAATPQIVNRRRKRREREYRSMVSRFRLAGLAALTIVSILLAGGSVWTALAYSTITQNLPSLEYLPLLLEPPNAHLLQPTRLYDRSGEHILLTIENPVISQRRYLPLGGPQGSGSLPQYLVDAAIASTDATFWEHSGFTVESLNLNSPRTITQQLIADLLLFDEPDSQQRRWRESLLASQATARFGRDKIIEWYLNSADYGHLAYGVESAAQVYFGKSAADLTLAEAALLAAIASAPDLNPIDAPRLTIERQGKVLEAMLAQGYITSEQALNANALPLEIRALAAFPENPYENFTNVALAQVSERFGLSRIQRGGLQIITTLDLDLQIQAACAASIQVSRLSEQPIEGEECQAARLLPTLRREDAIAAPGVDASVVVIDPLTGQILALVGDAEEGHTPGSLLAPFVYLTAFTRGFSPASLVW